MSQCSQSCRISLLHHADCCQASCLCTELCRADHDETVRFGAAEDENELASDADSALSDPARKYADASDDDDADDLAEDLPGSPTAQPQPENTSAASAEDEPAQRQPQQYWTAPLNLPPLTEEAKQQIAGIAKLQIASGISSKGTLLSLCAQYRTSCQACTHAL